MSASPFTGSPFSPGLGSPVADPLEGAQFGFTVPQGDPGAIRTAGVMAAGAGMALSFRAQDVTRAATEASTGWTGTAESAFGQLASQTSTALTTNSDAFTRAGTAMTALAGQLEHAQQVTRQAAQQCATFQTQVTTAQTAAGQAKSTRGSAAATRSAGQAQGELDACKRRGVAAATAYAHQAAHAAAQIAAAAADLVAITPTGVPAPPIPVAPGDPAIAKSAFGKIWNARDGDGNDPGGAIDKAAGRRLTPGQLLLLSQMYKQEKAKGKGSIWDGIGGFVHGTTGGLVGWGDPYTARYRGGNDASWIPLTPGGLVHDGEKVVETEGEKEAEHLLEKELGRDVDKDPHGTQYDPDHPGPLDPGDAATFTDGSYKKVVTDQPITLYRVHGGRARELGGFWTRTEPTDLAQTRRDLALNPAWGNTGEKVSKVTVPAGTTFYEGTAAPQKVADGGTLPGGGNQIFFTQQPPKDWLTR